MASLSDGTGVVVVHGLNPADLSNQAANAKSNLAPKLPLAATAPALCGELSSMPTGGPDTGAGSTGGPEHLGLLGIGGGLLAAAGATYVVGRRRTRARSHTSRPRSDIQVTPQVPSWGLTAQEDPDHAHRHLRRQRPDRTVANPASDRRRP